MVLLALWIIHVLYKTVLGMDLPSTNPTKSDQVKFSDEILDFRRALEYSSFHVYLDPGNRPFEHLFSLHDST